MSDATCINSLRLSAGELDTIIAALEREQPGSSPKSKRRARRWSAQAKKIILTTMDAGGSPKHFSVLARNLSSGGLAVLHGGFIHKGSKCYITLRGIDGKPRTLGATIVRCNHLQKHLHDLGVKFDAPVNPRDFLDFGDAHVFTVENVTPSELKGKVLVIEDSKPYQALMASYFKETGLDVTYVPDAESGLQCLSEGPQIVFVDYHMPGDDGISFIQKARAAFYEGAIVMLTADTTPGLRDKAIKVGGNELLVKPCPAVELHRAVAEYLLRPKQPTGAKSGDFDKPANITQDMLDMFLRAAKEQADALSKSIETTDLEAAKESVRLLRSSAEGYGFIRLSELARGALKSLDASMSVEESASELHRLVVWCRKAEDECARG